MTLFAIDFDGTCVEHTYPDCGPDVPGAVETLRLLADAGHRLILWTMRSGETLDEAVGWFGARELPLYGVNENREQGSWTRSPKAYAHVYIDDAALGCPLVHPPATSVAIGRPRPYVDWTAVRERLRRDGHLPPSAADAGASVVGQPHAKEGEGS